MDPVTISRINQINQVFYSNFGSEFSLTRGRIQPGVRRIMEGLSHDTSLLDVGCGNGEFANALANNGYNGSYVGIDFSAPLLQAANTIAGNGHTTFQKVDLTEKEWQAIGVGGPFTVITCFAVLHHIAGNEQRSQILQNIKKRLSPEGIFYLSNWQFLNSTKLIKRIQPWEDYGFNRLEVEPNDYLIDWKSGGVGLRYAHHFSDQELRGLAESNGFYVLGSFLSDGATGNLGLYQAWKIS